MLDWDALIPPAAIDPPPESGKIAPKTGDIPGFRGPHLSLSGIGKHNYTNGLRTQSPESPQSPVQKRSMDTKSSAGGVGEGKTNCARESIFWDLGDLRTCDLCGNLAESGRCSAAARREIVASRT